MEIEIKNDPMSPASERRRIENEKLREEWRMCGSGTSRHLVKYITQMSFALAVMVFSIVQLSDENNNDREIYFSLLSFILGIIFPHPQIKNDD